MRGLAPSYPKLQKVRRGKTIFPFYRYESRPLITGRIASSKPKTMISISLFTCVRKEGSLFITGMEDCPCPNCAGELFVHGTCKRNLISTKGKALLRLRVMECKKCGATHRELPLGLVPFKQFSVEMVCALCGDDSWQKESGYPDSIDEKIITKESEHPEDLYTRESSVHSRIKIWLEWFISYVSELGQSEMKYNDSSEEQLCIRLRNAIRFVVNSGRWKQQHHLVISTI